MPGMSESAVNRTRKGCLAESLRKRVRQAAPCAKRRPGQEKGVESWYRYYAGYTEEFAELALEAAATRSGGTVLDPWNGSGTTTSVADARGFEAIGIDINPFASLVASAKLARPADAAHVLGFARRVAALALEDRERVAAEDPLHKWLSCPAVEVFRAIELAVISDLASEEGGRLLRPIEDVLPPLAAFLLLCLVRAARSFIRVRESSNPTWIRPNEGLPNVDPSDLCTQWHTMIEAMAADLNVPSIEGVSRSRVLRGDSRSLPLGPEEVDLVLTSPPYCTRIDYVVNTSFELAALGIGPDDPEYSSLRRECMGTPLSRRQTMEDALRCFPASVRTLVERIRRHPSKASSSYYFRTNAQYFSDALASAHELFRVIKGGGAAVLVLQSSYYKDVYIDLPSLWVDIGEEVGFAASIVRTSEVTKSLAQINRRSIAHRPQKVYREAVLLLEKTQVPGTEAVNPKPAR